MRVLEEKKNDRINLLYRNLEYNSNAYIAAETAFPFWESAYALIIGQLFIAYFQKLKLDLLIDPHMLIALLGLALSFFWFVLVSLNLQNSNYMDSKIQESHNLLRRELNCIPAGISFIEIYPLPIEKANWSTRDIFWGNKPGEKYNFKKMLKSTWFYRRLLPFILCFIWFGLMFGYLLPTIVVCIIIYIEIRINIEDRDRTSICFE